jgi:aspartate/methionine/tyrosine aminotransferase
VEIAPFAIERFYAQHEFTTRFMLSSSDCESTTIGELLALDPAAHEALLAQRLGYTEDTGAPYLRATIASLYERVEPDDVLVLTAAEEGIFTAYHALLRPGDRVVVETPCYGSALEVARSAGAEVVEWYRRFEDGWRHDVDELERLLEPDTRLLYVNTPHNPTGTQMPRAVLDRVVELARDRGAVLFSDEVYRELEHDPAARLPAACDLAERAISLGSISKTYGLPGLRLGWIVVRDEELREAIRGLKHYTTICSPAPSELLVDLALRHRAVLVERNLGLVHRNLPLLDAFLGEHAELFDWVRPTAGPIGFPRVLADVDVYAWCEELAQRADVLLLPGDVYAEPRHVRLGFGRANMPEALEQLRRHLLG